MAEFNIRTDSVDVEHIMRQIRARIKEKRGVDYTEEQIQELANVKLERFLDPKGVRSDLVEQFKRTRGTSPEPPNYGFEDTTLYETHRGIVRFIRKLLNPILKMMFNPNPIVHVLHMQGEINNINAQQFRVREEVDALYYELIHNLVLEVTRLGIESKSLKMRLESLSSRMDFDERRARALEGVVQYKSGTGAAREAKPLVPPSRAPELVRDRPPARQPDRPPDRQPEPDRRPDRPSQAAQAQEVATPPGTDSQADVAANGTARRRRRRRRGRRGGRGRGLGENPNVAGVPGAQGSSPDVGPEGAARQPQSEYYDSEADGTDSEPGAGEDEGPGPSEQ